jgi:MarR family transcriptional regulator, negative regulator of the multidrug operon emrRAB
MANTDVFELIECMTALIRSEERKKCTEFGLQAVHFQVLNYLSRCNKFSDTPAAVANYLGMTRGTVSQSLMILERKGYIQKQQDSKDKRVIHLSLLPAGSEVLKQARPSNLFADANQILSSGHKIAQDAGVFQQALTALQKANQSQSFGICKTCRNFSTRNGQYYCQLTHEYLTDSDSHQICQEHQPN